MGYDFAERDKVFEDGVSIILPTFLRPQHLVRALESLEHQTALGLSLELIVSDNDPKASAETAVRRFANSAPFAVYYVHVPEPGVANARNRALDIANGRYIAFLDDDQVASENWVAGLLSALFKFNAVLAFCPIQARSSLTLAHKAERLDFFSRDVDLTETTLISDFFGSGSSMLDRQSCQLPTPVFDLNTNETGGEDDLLFSRLQRQDAVMVWTPECHAFEDVEDWRMSLSYIRMRSFAFGQGPSRICADPQRFNFHGLIRWMVIGLAQFAVYAPLAVFAHLFKQPRAVPLMRKAAEGAGKVLWFEPFRPKIYGANGLKAQIKRQI